MSEEDSKRKRSDSVSKKALGLLARLGSVKRTSSTKRQSKCKYCHVPREPKASTTEPKVDTTKPKVHTAKVKDTAKPKDDTAKPKADTTEPKADTTEPKVDTTEPKVDTAKLKVDTTELKDDTAKPKVDTTELKDDTAKPKDDPIEPKDNTAKPEDDPTEPKDNTAKPKDGTTIPKDDTTKPEDGITETVYGTKELVDIKQTEQWKQWKRRERLVKAYRYLLVHSDRTHCASGCEQEIISERRNVSAWSFVELLNFNGLIRELGLKKEPTKYYKFCDSEGTLGGLFYCLLLSFRKHNDKDGEAKCAACDASYLYRLIPKQEGKTSENVGNWNVELLSTSTQEKETEDMKAERVAFQRVVAKYVLERFEENGYWEELLGACKVDDWTIQMYDKRFST